jgi:hypothetical protein
VLDDHGKLQRFVKLFINKEQIDSTALESPLAEFDCVEVLAAIAGQALTGLRRKRPPFGAV